MRWHLPGTVSAALYLVFISGRCSSYLIRSAFIISGRVLPVLPTVLIGSASLLDTECSCKMSNSQSDRTNSADARQKDWSHLWPPKMASPIYSKCEYLPNWTSCTVQKMHKTQMNNLSAAHSKSSISELISVALSGILCVRESSKQSSSSIVCQPNGSVKHYKALQG